MKKIKIIMVAWLEEAGLYIFHGKKYRAFVKLYQRNYFIKSLVQMAPWAAPFIENALEKSITDKQRENFIEFLRILEIKLTYIKIKFVIDDFSKLGIESSYIERVVLESERKKLPYLAGAFVCFYYFKNTDYFQSDVFPRHYFDIVSRYTTSHLYVLKELNHCYDADECSGFMEKDALKNIGSKFNLHGGVLYKILMDFLNDHLVVMRKIKAEGPWYGLGVIDWVMLTEYGLNFYTYIISPPWEGGGGADESSHKA